jgi:hypothetical protein
LNPMNETVHREEDPMADSRVTILHWLRKQVEQLDTDLVRELLKLIAEYIGKKPIT